MSTGWGLVIGCALLTAAIKAAGPVLLGGRTLPAWFSSLASLMAPALLAALVATHVFTEGHRIAVSAATAGVAVSGLVMWRTRSVPLCVVTAAVVTAVLRALA
jgi:branched-subunit amino acid transport protein